jgi:RNA polymerase sigma-70 factor (ECF subfamily)
MMVIGMNEINKRMSQCADRQLVERVKEGDSNAYGELFEKHRARLLQMVMGIVHDRAEAEDVVQEAFIKAYRALPSFRGDAAFFTWLACIGMNTAKNFLTMRKRRMTADLAPVEPGEREDGAPDERTDFVTPEDVCACREMVAIVDAAFETMNTDQRTAISLHEVQGMSYQEIADAMGSPIGTVRSRISDARLAISRQLEQATTVSADKLAAYSAANQRARQLLHVS